MRSLHTQLLAIVMYSSIIMTLTLVKKVEYSVWSILLFFVCCMYGDLEHQDMTMKKNFPAS